jgi:hypothetical protein
VKGQRALFVGYLALILIGIGYFTLLGLLGR